MGRPTTSNTSMIAQADRPSHPASSTEKGLLYDLKLPHKHFTALWDAVIVDPEIKDRLMAQALLNFTLRPLVNPAEVPLHVHIPHVHPPGTGQLYPSPG